jgi:glutamate formiminotransferase / formiminotetrahydrofolate cyclodeaminase
MPIVECVPNFSEGRDPAVIAAIRDAIAGVTGRVVLDVSSDASHHRTVVTFVAPLEVVADAAFAGIREATARIDLTKHEGEHPRLGATDVVPFIPLDGARWTTVWHSPARSAIVWRASSRFRCTCTSVRRAHRRARTSPMYGAASSRAFATDRHRSRAHPRFRRTACAPHRRCDRHWRPPVSRGLQHLPRPGEQPPGGQGGGQGRARVERRPALREGHGPRGGRAGAGVHESGGPREATPLHRVFEMVRSEAAAHGVAPTWSELVGLVPERVLLEAGARHVQLRGYSPNMLIESRVREVAQGGEGLDAFVARVASPAPTPGGGSVAAHAGALGAALAQMVTGLTIGRKKYAAVDAEMKEIATDAATLRRTLSRLVTDDATSYDAVRAAYQLPSETEEQVSSRAQAIEAALIGAALVPLETARAAAQVCVLAARVAEHGNRNAVSDAAVAALLAEAACKGAVWNVRINVSALAGEGADVSAASRVGVLLADALEQVALAADAARRAERHAESSLTAGS